MKRKDSVNGSTEVTDISSSAGVDLSGICSLVVYS